MGHELVQLLPDDEHNRNLAANVRPSNWINPTPSGRYNLVVIGAGTASFAISADGTAARLTDLPAFSAAPEAAFVWTHLHVRQEGAQEWLEKEAKLDSAVVAAMMAEDTRPRAVIKEDGAMIILRAMNLHEGESPEEMISVRMWVDAHRVITTRLRNIKAIDEVQESVAFALALR